MIVVSFETKKDQKIILEKAKRFFVDTVGLKLTEEDPCCLTFKAEDKLGYVRLTLSQIEKKFDIVICSHVLEHVSDLSNLVTKLKEQLKSNGIIYAEVPQEIWAGLRIDADPVTHVNFFSLNSFLSILLLCYNLYS